MTGPCVLLAVSVLTVLSLAKFDPVLAQAEKQSKASMQQEPLVNDLGALLLVRMMLVTLHNASVTGNYSVLRDLGTPQFRVANTPLTLAEATKTLRAKDFRLDIASIATPVLLIPPHRDQEGRLRLYGYMPTKPEQVMFDLRYLYIGKRWMIQGMRVNIGKVPPKIAEVVAKRVNSQQRKAREQGAASPKGSALSTDKGGAGANAAPSHPDVDADALAAFGQHLRSQGVLSTDASPPQPLGAKR